MRALDPARLHVRLQPGLATGRLALPRRYTLTHSDRTGDLFLSIAREYDRQQISGWYTRLMRDEVLAEWIDTPRGPAVDVHCHVSGGIVFGSATWRDSILRLHMPMVIEAFRQGDAALFTAQPELDRSPVRVHFHSHRPTFDRIESRGTFADYPIRQAGTSSPPVPAD